MLNAPGKLGELSIIPYKDRRYLLFDPAAESPRPEDSTFTADAPLSGIPQWDGANRIAFSERRNGIVTLFRCDDPKALKKICEYNVFPGTPDRVVFAGGRMWIPANNSGLFSTENLEVRRLK